jgi:hypothetical protein
MSDLSDPKAWAVDISFVSDFASDASGPVRLSLPTDLHLAPGALVALMDKGRCCGLAIVHEHESTLVVLPVSFEPNLLVSPLYGPKELDVEDRAKLFGRDEAHLRRLLQSVSVVTASPIAATTKDAPATIHVPAGPPSNIILYGPPGTGKTYSVRRRALELIGATTDQVQAKWEELQNAGQIVFCTFHQAFAYEEFVEGLRARTDDGGNVHYAVEPGIFKRLAKKATDQPQRAFVLVVDEINRANIARVFGELITLLERDKRIGGKNELRVELPTSKEWFGVPANLHVLGTMNTADRSIALMDVALRRRFTFEEMMPDSEVLERELQGLSDLEKKLVVGVFNKLNERLRFLYDREHQIGHADFLEVENLDGLREVFATKIIPLLQEYFFGHWEKVALALGHKQTKDGPEHRTQDRLTILTVQKVAAKSVFDFVHDDYEDQFAWEVHPAFRSRGSFDGWTKEDIEKVFREVAGDKAP